MKETIYTIPLIDALKDECGCAFCALEHKLEQDELDFTLGDSMMEPDRRILTNKTGFCGAHLKLLYDNGNRLSLALMLSTHMEYLQSQMETMEKSISVSSKGILKKSQTSIDDKKMVEATQHCVICDKLQEEMKRYFEVFYYLWQKDTQFVHEVETSSGFCIRHMMQMITGAQQHVKGEKTHALIQLLISMQKEHLNEDIDRIKGFIDMFDYRNQGKDNSRYQNAVINALSRLRGN